METDPRHGAGTRPRDVPQPPINHEPAPPIGRLTWRLEDIAMALGISRRALERERSAGRLPRPDLTIGRMPLWTPETIRGWIERGGRP